MAPCTSTSRTLYALAVSQSNRSRLCREEIDSAVEFLSDLIGERDVLRILSGKPVAAQLDSSHWLEVEDKRHRYGSYLRPYYEAWLVSGSSEGFFEFLDRGSGRNLDLTRGLPANITVNPRKVVSREQLEKSWVHYCHPEERAQYKAIFDNGYLVWANDHRDGLWRQYDKVHTGEEHRWIFVVSLNGDLYLNRKEKARFHHSSFFAGGKVIAAGRIVVLQGIMKVMEPRSGHYRTTTEQFKRAVVELVLAGVDLTNAEVNVNLNKYG